MQSGLTIQNKELIVTKAKEKNNGVYRFRGIVYRVVDKQVTHFALNGDVFENAGVFVVCVGKYDGYQDVAAKHLKSIPY